MIFGSAPQRRRILRTPIENEGHKSETLFQGARAIFALPGKMKDAKIKDSASHHEWSPGTPRNTAHMRQHGKFEYLKSKNWSQTRFPDDFLENLILSFLDGFGDVLTCFHAQGWSQIILE